MSDKKSIYEEMEEVYAGIRRPRKIADFKTYIPEKGVWVSTVAWNMRIGLTRNSETMVFPGNERGITDYGTVIYSKSHGFIEDTGEYIKWLKKKHNEIVEKIKSGEINTEEPEFSEDML